MDNFCIGSSCIGPAKLQKSEFIASYFPLIIAGVARSNDDYKELATSSRAGHV